MTAPLVPSNGSLRALIAADVPRRREGGGAFIACHLGKRLESRRHSATDVFQEDPFGSDNVSPRLGAKSGARRLDHYLALNRNEYSIVEMPSPENHRALTGKFGQPRCACRNRYENHVLALPQ